MVPLRMPMASIILMFRQVVRLCILIHWDDTTEEIPTNNGKRGQVDVDLTADVTAT
jgi:hypothetical protein